MRIIIVRWGFLLALAASALSAPAAPADRFPDPGLDLVLKAPITTWDEAVPLGNGLLGGLLWGEGNVIRLSLDRGDLWDERPAGGVRWDEFNYATMQRLVAAGKNDELNAIFDHPYNAPHPTKIPAGRLEIVCATGLKVEQFQLALASAEGRARFGGPARLDAFFSAAAPVALARITGPEPVELRLRAPESVGVLGYPAAQPGVAAGARWFLQEAAGGLRYCVCVASRRAGGETLLAATVTSTVDGGDPVAVARERTAAALDAGYTAMLAPHLEWWREFWNRSRVEIPEQEILRHYYLVQYFYGAASRRGAPPMPLQGVWTADAGSLPPWKGDYHNDLNTQMTYIAYQAAGRFEEGLSYLEFLWERLPVFRKFAKDFYDAPGAAVPGVMSLAGQALGGWGHYSLSPTMGAWSAHLFYLHWRYTGDERFLRERAYPWCREIGECIGHLLKPDANGVLVLPLSTSPEIHDNSARAWLVPNTNYDFFCLRMLYLSLAEMAEACGARADAERWRSTAAALGTYHVNAEGALRLDAVQDLPGSHRHLSNIIGLHPFNLVTADGDERDRRAIAASLAQWDRLGTGAWCGYSFSWMACLRARVGMAEEALRNLDIYVKAFNLRNGFHANGDQTGSGFSGFTYRPFTLEGNFLAAQAVHEMLLQSWSPTPGAGETQVVRIFPAMPWRWHAAAFEDLRAEGGLRVSARRERNATVWLRVTATRGGKVRIRDNFGGRAPAWSRAGVAKEGADFVLALEAGARVEATLPAPAAILEAPPNAAEPVVLSSSRVIKPDKLPLRIGADSAGGSRFLGDIARAAVFGRALAGAEIARLFEAKDSLPPDVADCVATWDLDAIEGGATAGRGKAPRPAAVVGEAAVVAAEGLAGRALRLDGRGFLEVPHAKDLDCLEGVTLEAWVRPRELPPSGARILDKSPVGAATAYNLDTYPGNSLRLIFRDPHLKYDAKLAPGRWTHVAGTIDGATGKAALYIDGRKVAED